MTYSRLVIAPHVDDEVIGAAASLDYETLVFYVGVDDFHIVSREERFKEAKEAQNIGNYSSAFPHNRPWKVNEYYKYKNELISEFESQINIFQPSEVMLPWPSYNQDHQTVYDAAMVALRPHDKNWFVNRVLLYEEPDCLWQPTMPFVPNFYRLLDIDKKLLMYSKMPSQIRGHRSPEAIKALARVRGQACMMEYAEAYHMIRNVE